MPQPEQPTAQPAAEPCAHPCGTCPYRVSNHRKPHPAKWYTPANLRRMHGGLMTGHLSVCHATDPEAPTYGGQAPPPGTVRRACVGALIIVQRHLDILNGISAELPRDAPKGELMRRYREATPNSRRMTRAGVLGMFSALAVRFPGAPVVHRHIACTEPVGVPYPDKVANGEQ